MTTLLTDNLALLAGSPNGVDRLRVVIRDLAVTGRLVPHEDDVGKWQWSTLGSEISGMDAGWSPACLDTPAPTYEVWGVLRTTAVQPLRYVQEENKELPAHLTPRPEAEVKAGDVLFTRAGPMNRVGISCLVDSTRPRLMLSDKIIRFRPNPQRLDGRFTALCLNAGATARYLEAAKSGMAASQVNISQAKLKAAPVPVPPLAEQHRIVAKVDELMDLCDRLEAEQADAEAAHAQLVAALLTSLTQARDAADFRASWQQLSEHFHTLFTTEASIDALKQTVLQLGVMGRLVPQDLNDEPATQLLARLHSSKRARSAKGEEATHSDMGLASSLPSGWCWASFGEICQIKSELVRPEDFLDSIQVAPDCIEKGTGRLLERRTVRQTGIRGPNNRFVAGQLLYSKIRPSLSKAVLVDFDGLCSADMYPINSHIDPRFQLSMMLSEMFLAQVRLAENRVKMPKLNQESLTSFVVPLPPLKEQSRIVAKVEELLIVCDQLTLRLVQARQHHEHLASVLVAQAVA
ncbi:restriction endonuclease subunit S [Paucibacter sp. DJ2R-2]|uniref:restriction endonuclease subunit S n=1 Tax=Paucibacter sp. DJ2R-2 TaxID=2893558 RepID=UPI0021E3A0BA|nr:restriction endonuclease subunit S [Paucibacter sp. DJ2R-2]MCV2437197.1 restriction endonuclease subunit S [Paucibacter sp. DJ2R-2]